MAKKIQKLVRYPYQMVDYRGTESVAKSLFKNTPNQASPYVQLLKVYKAMDYSMPDTYLVRSSGSTPANSTSSIISNMYFVLKSYSIDPRRPKSLARNDSPSFIIKT